MSPGGGAASEAQMRAVRLETKSRANSRYDRGAACCNNMPCASNGPSRVYTRALLSSPPSIRGVSAYRPFTLRTPLRFPPLIIRHCPPVNAAYRRARQPIRARIFSPPVNRFPSPPSNLWIAGSSTPLSFI